MWCSPVWLVYEIQTGASLHSLSLPMFLSAKKQKHDTTTTSPSDARRVQVKVALSHTEPHATEASARTHGRWQAVVVQQRYQGLYHILSAIDS